MKQQDKNLQQDYIPKTTTIHVRKFAGHNANKLHLRIQTSGDEERKENIHQEGKTTNKPYKNTSVKVKNKRREANVQLDPTAIILSIIDKNISFETDINECDVDNGGCPSPQVCLNEPGTFHCQCKPGYVFTPDKQSCVDEDECTSGTANCSHVCTNEVGSYRCSCKDGFVLSEDQHSCEDYDECTAKEYPCMQDCHNTIGAFVCSCLNGFELQSDGKTCVDIDECSEQLSGCEHECNNSVGSFVCSCAQGFQLDSNNRTCVDEDDCLSVVCSNGGTCEDGISSYSCKCPNGYSGSNCHFDLDECQSFNGGCEEICTNLIGSYKCSCPAGRTLLPDGHTCSGGTQRQSVFENFLLPRNHLPRGCHSLTLHTSVGGVSQPLTMLSTSPWYTRTSNTDVVVTDGVVMLAVGSASVPLSLEGVELDQSRSNSIIKQYKGRSFSDMVPIPTEVISETDCISGNLTYLDFYDFIQFGSFQNTIFNSLEATLPIWLSFGKANKIDRRKRELIQSDNLHLRKKRSILNVDNPDSRLILGSEIENINSCKGAPIKFDNIYSVFLLRSNFSVKIFDNTIFLNQFANGKEFCLINDISEPGSVFLLIPEESRDEFMKLDIFQTTHNATGILIKPRGIGLSLVKSVQVPSKHKDVTLWNGDHTFQYS
ncbi:hypothetical protein FSP39_019085 [Pinctada imbricata]|uniref:EGF-like domain-containing protein n=1 Tax=Pinctada imbricata TaxID=66713 RepID=A0AA88YER0_PINIB|nr:hypothetical protein FSP39_019085 [Pinctada imbricata]